VNPSKYAFQAGLFILLSIAGAIFLVARVAESRRTPSDARLYVAVFDAGEDIAGLSPGAEVRLMGLKVGRVESVEVVKPARSEDDAKIHVGFVVGDGLELRTQGAIVELQTAVTGGAWLNILSVGHGVALAEGGQVSAKASNLLAIMADVRDEVQITMAALRKDLDDISTELVQTADSIEKSANTATVLIEKMDQKFEPMVKDFDTLLAEATGVMTDIRGVFGDSGTDIRTTLANLNTITTGLDQKLPATFDEITGLVSKASHAIGGVETLLADNKPNIDRMVESAKRSADELEGLVDDLRANPSRLIWPPDEKDLNNLELYATARAYAKAAEDLESAAAALQQASALEGIDPAKLEALRTGLIQQFEHFDKLQDEMWTRFEK